MLTTTLDDKRRKRGRPPKKISESPVPAAQSLPQAHTPQLANQPYQTSPPQASPTTKSTPTKNTVLKALPTVRDHTTDQLNPEGDEYIPREHDEAGERKVTQNGQLLDGRQYRCRTFYVPNRGDKLFMLATECARVLGYRDSYLLFNKNRSLHKIIANQPEKDDLIQQEILPYSYRSRQIAIVTARSMFRQFGSRLIVNGRRVRDDYWESKARKQGFTEEDAAGEKRPGAAKQREAAAAAEASNLASLTALPHGDIIYTNGPRMEDLPRESLPTLTDDLRPRDYSNVQRPRHEISGTPYIDRTQPSTGQELLNQAGQTAEFNKSITQQRANRTKFLEDIWSRPHESPVPGQRDSIDNLPPGSQAFQSPQMSTASGQPGGQGHAMLSHQPVQHGQSSQMMTPHTYQQLPSSYVAQSPIRQPSLHLPGQNPAQQPQRSPNMPLPGAHNQPPSHYGGGYPQQSGMWPPPQPGQPSPLSQQHHPGGGMQYPSPQHLAGAQQSPHMAQRHSPMHQQPQTPQLHHSSSTGSLHSQMGPANPYGNMGPQGMGMPQNMMYGGQQRSGSMYGGTPTPQQFLQHGGQSQAGGQGGMQGWAGQQGGGGAWGQGF